MTTRLLSITSRPSVSAIPAPPLNLSRLPVWAGLLSMGIGLMVLLGWVGDIDMLKSMIPGVLTMKANAAVCFGTLGAGLVLLSRTSVGPAGRRIGVALVWATIAIASITGAEYLTGIDVGLDQLLFREPLGGVGSVIPGRMAPATVIGLASLGLAVLLGRRAPRIVITLSVVALSLSYLNILDLLFDADVPTFLVGYTQMATNTAVAMGILGVGALARLGAANPFASLAGGSSTAVLLRRLLVVSVTVVVAMAWLRLEGQRGGLYDTSFGTSLMVVGITLLNTFAIVRSARWAAGLEMKRQALELERDRFFELSLDLLAVFDADGRFRRVNRAWEVTLGYPAGELIGRPLFDLIHPDDLERTVAAAQLHFGDGERVEAFQNRYRHHDGSYRWLEWMSRMAPDNSIAFSVARDVTERKHAEDRRAKRQRVLETRNETLSKQAVRDPLTGLYNRRHFDTAVARLELRWRRLPVVERPPVSVVLFDLDDFGNLNKLHGHQAGDTVLRLFAEILKKRFRESDLVARYGGEEFVAILEGATSADAVRIAEDIRASLERASIDIGTDSPIRVTVSAGCAQLSDDGDVSAGLSVADVWLAQAKRGGRNQVVGL